MVQNTPTNYVYGYQNNNGNYNNWNYFNNSTLNDDFMFNATFRNLNQQIPQDTYTPQFTGTPVVEEAALEEAPKKKGWFGKILGGIALIGGAILLKKNWSKVSQFVDDIIKRFKGGKKAATTVLTPSQQKAQQTIQRNANRVPGPRKAPRKHRLEHTVPNKNPKPITNAREAQVIENINLSHVDANTRKMVEKAGAGTVSTAQQKAYDRAIAYQAPTAAQKTAMAERHAANAAQRRELNSIAQNSTGAEKLVAVKTAAQAEAQAVKAVTSGPIRHANGNIYHVKDGVITKVELFQRNKAGELVKNTVELTDPTKIAKHMAKQGVKMSDFIPQGAINVAA